MRQEVQCILSHAESTGKSSYHHVPWLGGGDGASHLQNHAGQQPEKGTNAVLALVVGGDGDVNVSHWRVRVTESNHGNVPQRGLHDRLWNRTSMLSEYPKQHHDLFHIRNNLIPEPQLYLHNNAAVL
jgi:hypothetical protein